MKGGANVNGSNKLGYTAFIYAAINNKSVEVLQTLLDCGADSNARDSRGLRAIEIVEGTKGHEDSEAYKFLLTLIKV